MMRNLTAAVFLVLVLPAAAAAEEPGGRPQPNVILVMADDLGAGDAGFRGHPVLRTPALDAMAAAGVRFERFYAAAPVCSPTRGSCLTGRHPYRYGITGANQGHLLEAEESLAEILRGRGYVTGHFGKWHLGTLTTAERDSNRGAPGQTAHHAPPWEHGFDVCFSTEAKVPTFDPMVTPPAWAGGVSKGLTTGEPYGTHYWSGPGDKVIDDLEGDDSRIIMDRAIPFIEKAAGDERPFFCVIWFHAPHLPVVASEEHLAPYDEALPLRTRHYYGCITALDEQVGRLRTRLRELDISRDTMLWFASDNGPEGRNEKAPGSTGGLRGRKRSLFEGGIRVPGLLEWPAMVGRPLVITAPATTSDYLPTVLDALGAGAPRLVDGVSLLPALATESWQRPHPIAFEAGKQRALIGNRFKLVQQAAEPPMLFDLLEDPGEQVDLAAKQPERTRAMIEELDAWRASCRASAEGKEPSGR